MTELFKSIVFGLSLGIVPQFFCCFGRSKAVKYLPVTAFLTLWAVSWLSSRLLDLRFITTVFSLPILAGIAAGWTLNSLFLDLWNAIRKEQGSLLKLRVSAALLALMILLMAGMTLLPVAVFVG